jgi:arylsulfatase A-like enzyme
MRPKFTFSRRDFLKLTSLLPLTWAFKPFVKLSDPSIALNKPNVILLVFDAWSALHVPLFGYVRDTMPYLEKFAANATVYHNHYSAGTFTVPGTASLLTGMHPWSHRAFQLGAGGIIHSQVNHQIFAALSNTRTTVGFAQNRFADLLLSQAENYIDRHIESGSFDVEHSFVYNLPFFKKDERIAYSSFEDNIFQTGDGTDSSLFIGSLYRLWVLYNRLMETKEYGGDYPTGLPDATELFRLGDLVDGAIKILNDLREPAFTYLHFYPPHGLYQPDAEFADKFNDGWTPVDKPIHPLAYDQDDPGFSNSTRLLYDQYLANWDAEVSRLFDFLETSGLLDRSYVIVTSDHGELFERGEVGHWTRLMYEAIMHVPLLISAPGQKERKDIYAFTSSVDLLPTLAQLTDNSIPAWCEGQVLPEFGGPEDPSRSIFTVDAKTNASFAPLTRTSISLTKSPYRLTYYKYPEFGEQFEFYNIVEDPDELQNLYSSSPASALDMRAELLQKLSEVNHPFDG